MKIKISVLVILFCCLLFNCKEEKKEFLVHDEINELILQEIDSVSYNELKEIAYSKDSSGLLKNIELSKIDSLGLTKLFKYEKSILSDWMPLPDYRSSKPTFLPDSLLQKNDNIIISRCSTKDKAPGDALRSPRPSNQRTNDFFLFEFSKIEIPINVHIVNNQSGYMKYDSSKTNPKLKVKKEHLDAQFSVLNDIFNQHNIFFTLSSIDSVSNGRWNESGTDFYSPSSLDGMLRALNKTPETHLNLYIIDGRRTGKLILGEAAFPWDVTAGRYNDYVVISARTMPGFFKNPADEGKTLIHEIGHYLGLWHTFEGGPHDDGCYYGDRVSDTASQKTPHEGPCNCNGKPCDTCVGIGNEGEDPTNNFMGYNDDNCMTELTAGQIKRIFQATALHREVFMKTEIPNL